MWWLALWLRSERAAFPSPLAAGAWAGGADPLYRDGDDMNPARAALTRAVNRAIAEGAPIIVEQPTLACLRERSRDAWGAFVRECHTAGFADEWAAYRAQDAGQPWPPALESAWQASNAATHVFYAARDGGKGFLGSRGL